MNIDRLVRQEADKILNRAGKSGLFFVRPQKTKQETAKKPRLENSAQSSSESLKIQC